MNFLNRAMSRVLALMMSLLAIPVLACGGSNSPLPTLVPTADAARGSASVEEDEPVAPTEPEESAAEIPSPTVDASAADADSLQAQMAAELRSYDYESQRVVVEDVEIRGTELIVHIRREGSPSLNDYFGQLGAIHGVIAINEPEVATVSTFDVEGRNGFVVDMDDLMDFYNGQLDFDTYRARWGFFEP